MQIHLIHIIESNCHVRIQSARLTLLALSIILLAGFPFFNSVSAQGGLNSPLSRFGIGDVQSESFFNLRQMGDISTSFIDQAHLNFANPASLSFLTSTAFDVGMDFQRSSLSDPNTSTTQWSGNMSYLGLGFPLRNPYNQLFDQQEYDLSWGMGFALMPHSLVSYEIARLDSLPETGAFERNFEGSGGLYKVLWGNSVRYKNLSFGLNLGYIFGKIDYTKRVIFLEEAQAYDNDFSTSYNARGFYWKIGLLYNWVLNQRELSDNVGREEPISLSIGFTAKANTGINTEANIVNLNRYPLGVLGESTDTLQSAIGIAGNGTLPGEISFGVTYNHRNKIAAGIDIRRTFWSNYRNDANPEQLNNTFRVSLGGYYRPDLRSIGSFFNRVYYRFGFFFEQDPRQIESDRIDHYGLTLGLGLPIVWQRKFSHANIGVKLGKRSVEDIINENYVKIYFGFTFNDEGWFIKRKFN